MAYRNREKIALTRTSRDPPQFIKKTMIDAGFIEADETKEKEKMIQKQLQKEVAEVKKSARMDIEEIFIHIYAKDTDKRKYSEFPPSVCLVFSLAMKLCQDHDFKVKL
eukprot:231118_1